MIITPLKVWVQNILPVVYDDSLSYLEIVAKINAKTNEIITQTNENTHAIETLAEAIAELGDIEELRALLDEIETIIEDLYTTDAPLMDGTASAGSANHAARSDHVHPSDTSKAPVNHTSSATTYGVGNANNYGHVKITDDINNTAGGTAIKPSVVKTVNDKLNTFTKDNILDNWYFIGGGSQLGDGIFPINQQGLTSYANQGYCIDRWRLRDSNNGGITIPTTGDGIVITINDSDGTGSTYKSFEQILDKNLLIGKQVTLSCIVSEYASTGVESLRLGIWAANNMVYHSSALGYADITEPGLYKVTVNIPADLSYTYLKCGILMVNSAATHGTASVKIQAVKLELGSEQTLVHQEGGQLVLNEIPNWADELTKCQRYYFPFPSAFRINATYRSSASIDFSFTMPVGMIGAVRFEAPSAKLFASTGSGGAFEEQSGFTYSIPDNTTDNGFVTIRASKSSHGLIPATAIVLQPYANAYLTTNPVEP